MKWLSYWVRRIFSKEDDTKELTHRKFAGSWLLWDQIRGRAKVVRVVLLFVGQDHDVSECSLQTIFTSLFVQETLDAAAVNSEFCLMPAGLQAVGEGKLVNTKDTCCKKRYVPSLAVMLKPMKKISLLGLEGRREKMVAGKGKEGRSEDVDATHKTQGRDLSSTGLFFLIITRLLLLPSGCINATATYTQWDPENSYQISLLFLSEKATPEKGHRSRSEPTFMPAI